MSLIVEGEKAARPIKPRVIAYDGEKVSDLTVAARCVAHTVGCEDRQTKGFRDPQCRLIPPLLRSLTMTLDFHVDMVPSKDPHELFHNPRAAGSAADNQLGAGGP